MLYLGLSDSQHPSGHLLESPADASVSHREIALASHPEYISMDILLRLSSLPGQLKA